MPDAKQTALLLGLIDYPEREEVRRTFLRALLDLPRIEGVKIVMEQHGVMRAVGILCDGKHCFSITTTLRWVKVWARLPELAVRPETADRMREIFPHCGSNKKGEITARILNEMDMLKFVQVVGFFKSEY